MRMARLFSRSSAYSVVGSPGSPGTASLMASTWAGPPALKIVVEPSAGTVAVPVTGLSVMSIFIELAKGMGR
jgi:hypothetical protein